MNRFWVAVLAVISIFCLKTAQNAHAIEFSDEIERDFPVRSLGQLNVTNLRGDVTIQGWSLDRIRVRARRVVVADAPENISRLFSALDFRFQNLGKDIDLSAEYGRGLTLRERLAERQTKKTVMHIFVQAPANFKLRLWTVDGVASVKNWNAPVEIRTASGLIDVNDVKNGGSILLCSVCNIKATGIRGAFRAIGGSGEIDLEMLSGDSIYVENESGDVRASKITGEQLYVLKGGKLFGRDLRGRVEFTSQRGNVNLDEISGFLSGKAIHGNISAKVREWQFSDKAFLETVDGSISLVLPANFSGELDAWSPHGKALVGLPLKRLARPFDEKTTSGMRLTGIVGAGGELLRVYSEKGDISVVKE